MKEYYYLAIYNDKAKLEEWMNQKIKILGATSVSTEQKGHFIKVYSFVLKGDHHTGELATPSIQRWHTLQYLCTPKRSFSNIWGFGEFYNIEYIDGMFRAEDIMNMSILIKRRAWGEINYSKWKKIND